MNRDLFNNQIKNMKNYIMFEIKARQTELTPALIQKNRKPIALSMGAPVDAVSDFVKQRVVEYIKDDSLGTYSTPKGEKKFLDAVKNRMKKRFNVELDSNKEIFSLIGSKEGISNMIKAIVNYKENPKEQDIILIPKPGYASYSQMILSSGALAWGIELNKENNYMPDLEDELKKLVSGGFDKNKVKALIINYPNNPLGCTCTKDYLQQCVDFCNKYDIVLISDNAYCEMYYEDDFKPHSILECKGAMDCGIEFHSLSKTYAMTGWRLGWACGNSVAVAMLSRMKSTVDTGIFKVLQYASADLIEDIEGQRYIDNQNLKFKNKIKNFTAGLASLGYDIEMPKATFYLWLKIPDRFSNCVDFANQMLEKSGIVAVPGTAFDKDAFRYVRLSVVASDEDLSEVIKRMREDGFQY